MTQSNNNELTLTDISQVLSKLDHIDERLGKLEQELRENNNKLEETNNRVEIYQKASTQVVNLAFSLIASANVTIIITSIFRK